MTVNGQSRDKRCFQPVAEENIRTRPDPRRGMSRLERRWARGEAPLGPGFEAGPAPTRQRACVNSESLVFTDEADVATLADPAAIALA
jgi:peptide methionine sulfoxide reductase MsrB